MMTSIKTCPYCSNLANVQTAQSSAQVVCSNLQCMARGPRRNNKNEAIEAWNLRHPDIGVDPLKSEDRSPESVHKRLMAGVSPQQPNVPDQTMLAWRIDVSDVCGELTWRRAAMKPAEKYSE